MEPTQKPLQAVPLKLKVLRREVVGFAVESGNWKARCSVHDVLKLMSVVAWANVTNFLSDGTKQVFVSGLVPDDDRGLTPAEDLPGFERYEDYG
jgi:hypothetical protein